MSSENNCGQGTRGRNGRTSMVPVDYRDAAPERGCGRYRTTPEERAAIIEENRRRGTLHLLNLGPQPSSDPVEDPASQEPKEETWS